MKLHLPCALRSALLACFALACTTPAWATWGDNTDSYTIPAAGGYIATISTGDTTSEAGNGYFLRAATEEGNEDPGSQYATIGTLTLINDKTFNVAASWDGSIHFKALTIESIQDSGSAAKAIVAANNTMYLGKGGQTAAETLGSNVILEVDGTLGVDQAIWNSIVSQINATGDGGNIALYAYIDTTNGTYDFSNYTEVGTEYVIENILTKEGLTLSSYTQKENLTIDFSKDSSAWSTKSQRGYNTELFWVGDQLNMSVTYLGVGRQEIYAEGVERPTAPVVPTDFVADKNTAGVLTQITTNTDKGDQAGSGWTIQVYGMVNRQTDDSLDLVLLTNTDQKISDTLDMDTDLGKGHYAIYLRSDGGIWLFRSGRVNSEEESTMGTMATYWQIGNVGTDWTTMEFSFNLSYKDMDGKYDAIVFDPNSGASYVVLYDADGNVIGTSLKNGANDTSVLRYGWANVEKKLSQNDLVSSIYTRLTENSYIALTSKDTAPSMGTLPLPGAPVVPENVNWYIVKNASATVEGLWAGDFVDYDTMVGTKMVDEENIVFTGGTLTTQDYIAGEALTQIILNNKISVEDGGTVKLAPGLNCALVITNGDMAMRTTGVGFNGLEIGGKTNSKVVLLDVAATDIQQVTVHSGAALEFGKSDTGTAREYTIDANNSGVQIDANASLGVSGGNTLIFKAKEDGSTVNELFCASSGESTPESTVTVANKLTANLVDVEKLVLSAQQETQDENNQTVITAQAATLHTKQGVLANTINVGKKAELTTDGTIVTTGAITMGVESEVKAAHVVSDGSISVTKDASLTADGALIASSLTLSKGSDSIKTQVAADSVNIEGAVTMNEGNAILTVGSLYAGGAISLGMQSAGSQLIASGQVQAASLSAFNEALVYVGSTGSLSTTGNSRFYNASAGSSGLLVTNTSAGLGTFAKGFTLTADTLTAAESSNILITIKNPGKAAPANKYISIGTATNTTIQNDAGTGVHILDTEFVNSTVIVTDATLYLTGTTHDDATTVTVTNTGTNTNAAVELEQVTMVEGASFQVGDSVFTVTDHATKPITLSGNAVDGSFAITSVAADLTDYTSADMVPETGFVFVESSTEGDVSDAGCSYDLKFAPGMRGKMDADANGDLRFTMWDASPEIVEEVANSENTRNAAGALVPASVSGAGGVIEELYDYVRNESEASLEQRRSALSALASGSITMLADSQRQGVTNNINKLRNRIVQMGNPQGIEWEQNIHAWISADGSYNDIDQDGGCAGYEYQTWGGTVGVHADSGNFSFGAAISAAYGDLTAHSADLAEGDHDSYNLSAFVRHQKGNWIQMGILSLGRNEIEVERSINTPTIGGDSKTYAAEGDSSGHTITGYYEVGYTISLNETHTQVIQPLVSLMLTSARTGEFTESGSIGNAALHCDTSDYFYGTLGIGARYQVVLAEDVNERLSFLEVRAKLVQDFGDETNEATVSFAGAPGSTFTVKGADVGRTGFQIGVGLSVPLGIYETFFADVDADIRSGATSINGSVGVRVEF